ncbi:MAG TPA: DUF3108 domain-containing protein [Myxococcales bacterium]|jgi:hypothetical protein
MRLTVSIVLAGLLSASLAWSAAPPRPAPQPPPKPSAAPPPAACTALPKPRSGPLPFVGGETLTYDVDVLGAKAGQMTFDVQPWARTASEIPVRVKAESNTFFNKMRKIKGEAVSYLRAKDLRPNRFHEDLEEGPLTRVADALFKDRKTEVNWKSNQQNNTQGANHFATSGEAFDYVGVIFLFRAIPMKVGQPFCFDAYAIKRMWRVEGKVEAREHVSVPAGEFDAFHLSGVATTNGMKPRDIHVWISDDPQRVPLAALGVLDLGPVRAQLTVLHRPDMKASAGKEKVEW